MTAMPAMPTPGELAELLARLAGEESAATDAGRIDQLAALEALKSAAAAAQARIAVSFDASQRAAQAAAGVPVDKVGQGVAAQVALARRESPHKGNRLLGLAKALVFEMPHTLHALATGQINEWRATLVVGATAVLSREHRQQVDLELAGRLGMLGDAGVQREARMIAYRLDPGSVVRRSAKAESERRVTLRPAPDTMSYLTGLLPVAQGVAVHAALTRHADSLRAAGDARTRGQIMADTLVERVTGQVTADDVPVEVQVVMTDRALLGEDDSPARLVGHGPVPAALARALARGSDHVAAKARAWVRRLYAHPGTGELVAMESTRREFPPGLRRFLVTRDEVCRTPWCEAPIRHADHVAPVAAGGMTSEHNGQGLCAQCNQAKESPGWASSPTRAGPRRAVAVRMPTGHAYVSTAPELPGRRAPFPTTQRPTGPMERRFATLVRGPAPLPV